LGVQQLFFYNLEHFSLCTNRNKQSRNALTVWQPLDRAQRFRCAPLFRLLIAQISNSIDIMGHPYIHTYIYVCSELGFQVAHILYIVCRTQSNGMTPSPSWGLSLSWSWWADANRKSGQQNKIRFMKLLAKGVVCAIWKAQEKQKSSEPK